MKQHQRANKLPEVHAFILQYWMTRQREPLLKEIAEGVGLASPSGAHYYAKLLKRKKGSDA